MRRFTKRMLSLFLSFLMVLSSLSVGLTAFAKSTDWDKSNLDTTYGDITKYIDAIAHALYGDADDGGEYSDIASTDEEIFSKHYYNYNVENPYTSFVGQNYGNILVDNANGDMLTAVKNAWLLLMGAYGLANKDNVGSSKKNTTTKLDVGYAWMIEQLRKYMGKDFRSDWEDSAEEGSHDLTDIVAHWFGAGDEWPGGGKQSYNTMIVLDPEYYLFKQYGDSISNLPDDVIPVVRSFWYVSLAQSSYPGANFEGKYRVNDYLANQVFKAIRINAEELKKFAELFPENLWNAFVEGKYEDITLADKIKILEQAQELYDAIWSAEHEATYNSVREKEENKGPKKVETTINSQDDPLSKESTQKVYEHYFGSKTDDSGADNFENYFNAFKSYMIKEFADAVDKVDTALKKDGVFNTELTLDELRDVKGLIDEAYSIYGNLPEAVQEAARAAKEILDDDYYKSSDDASNPSSFVVFWNSKVAQSYIDVTEQLEYCSDIYNKQAPEEEKYAIESDKEAKTVKSLLDEADSLYADLLWEDTYEKTKADHAGSSPKYTELNKLNPNLVFESTGSNGKISPTAKALDWARKVHRGDGVNYGAQAAYENYFLRRFLAVAQENLGEYFDENGSVVLPSISAMDIVPVRSKIRKVENLYKDLPERFKGRQDVQKYLNVIEAIEKQLESALTYQPDSPKWEDAKKDFAYPYYYNWDEKNEKLTVDSLEETNEAAALLDSLNGLINSDAVKNLIGQPSLKDFVMGTVNGLLTGESANNLVKLLLQTLMPMIQDAMEGVPVDVAIVHTNALDLQRYGFGGLLKPEQVNIMFPDPNHFEGKLRELGVDGLDDNGEEDKDEEDILTAARVVGSAQYDWDAVDWDKVDWKIDNIHEFSLVVGGILRCVHKLVNSLLFNEEAIAEVAFAGGITQSFTKAWNNGYEKDIIPFLELLGCKNIKSFDEAKVLADDGKWDVLVEYLLTTILNRVEELLTGDVLTNIIKILPNLAYLLQFDLIMGKNPTWPEVDESEPDVNKRGRGPANNDGYGLRDLIAPLYILANLSMEGFGIDSLSGDFIMDTVNGLLESTGFTLPDLDWAKIAGLGTYGEMPDSKCTTRTLHNIAVSDDDANKIFVYIIYWLSSFVTENETAINDLLENAVNNMQNLSASLKAKILELKDRLLTNLVATASDEREFAACIFELLRPVDTTVDFDWSKDWSWKQALVQWNQVADKYTKEDVTGAIETLDGVVDNLLNHFLFKNSAGEVINLETFLTSNVLTGKTINSLFKSIYSLDSDTIRTLLPLIEIKDASGTNHPLSLKPSDVASHLSGYPEIAELLNQNDHYTEKDAQGTVTYNVFDKITDDMWQVKDIDSFFKALEAILYPFRDVAGVLLAGHTSGASAAASITIGNAITVSGANGYGNSLKALLAALGAGSLENTTLMDDGAFTAKPADSLHNLLDMVSKLLKQYIKAPLDSLLGAVPSLASFMDNGGLQTVISQLIRPFWNVLSALLDLFKTDNDFVENKNPWGSGLFDILSGILFEDGSVKIDYDNLQNNLFDIINHFLKGVLKVEDPDLKALDKDGDGYVDGSDPKQSIYKATFDLKIPAINWASLGGCGTKNGQDTTITADRESVLVKVLRYLWNVVFTNKDAITGYIGDQENIKPYLDRIFDEQNGLKEDDFVALVISILDGVDSSNYVADWSFLTKNYKSKRPVYPKGMNSNDIEGLIKNVSSIVENALREFILKGDYATLADLVGGKLYTQSLIDTVKNAINNLAENATVAQILPLLGIELSVNEKTYKVTGKASFIDALADILSPFEPLVNVLLNKGEISIANVVTIKGSDGFNNAIKPLLEYALGAKNVKDSSLKGILTSLLGRVEQILKNPVKEMISIIPMLTNFINKGGVQYFVEGLLYPIVNIAGPAFKIITGSSLFDFVFDLVDVNGMLGTKGLTWKNITGKIPTILNGFLKGIKIGKGTYSFTVNKLDFAALAACGKANGLVVNGKNPDTFVTLFDIIWKIVQENRNVIDRLVKSLGLGDKVNGYIKNLLNNKSQNIVEAVDKVLQGLNASNHKANWSFLFKNYKTTSVKYPSGVTSGDLEKVIVILTEAIENALAIFLNTSVPKLVSGNVYTSDIANSLAKAVNSLAGNKTVQSIFGLLGINLKANNKTYTVTNKASFINAITEILKPFEPLVNALLSKGEITIANIVKIKGADGFNNAVKPLLEYALGVKNVNNRSLKGIITAVLNRVDVILANPVEELIDVLPALSNFIGKGGVQYFVEELLYPVINIVDPVLKLITKQNLFDFAFNLLGVDLKWSNAQNRIIPLVNSMLTNIKINGKSYSIKLPSINWSKLGGCGKLKGTRITANTTDALMTVLNYVFKALNANKNILYDVVGEKNSTVGQIITNVLKQGSGGMAKIIVNILLKMKVYDNVDWTFRNIKELETKYTENYDKDDYTAVLDQLDDMISTMLPEQFNISLSTILNDTLYKNSIVNTVAKLIYTNIEKINIGGIDINKILKALDLNITTKSVAKMLNDFGSASAEIGKHAKWSQVNFDALKWNFTDGDKDGFIQAICAVLRPIQPVLRVILSGEDLVVLGSIRIKGGNGYNTAIIPLLEALGVSPSELVSPQQYANEASTDRLLTDILNPLFDKVEELLQAPLRTLCEMLPNIAYFLYNDGALALVENLAAPVFNILDEIAPIYKLDLDLSMLRDLDLDELINKLLKSIKIDGQPLGIQITNIDLAQLAGRGEMVTYRSARTYYGEQMDAKMINADATGVFISVLRYLVENLQVNLDAIKNLLAGLGLSGDVADIVNQVLGFLVDYDVDGVIENLMGLVVQGSGDSGLIDKEPGNAPYPVGNFSWVHWVVLCAVTLFFILILILLNKKKDEEGETQLIEGEEPPKDRKAKKAAKKASK